MTEDTLILASGSKIRSQILSDAGIKHRIQKPDEGAEPDEQKNESSYDYVMRAACCKGINVSEKLSEHYVLASDQVVEFEGQILRKVPDVASATERLKKLADQSHYLIGAWCLYHQKEIIAKGSSKVEIFLHKLCEDEIIQYLEDEKPLSSVACYYIEGKGSRLIREIKGDYFSALGLALHEINAAFRKLKLSF